MIILDLREKAFFRRVIRDVVWTTVIDFAPSAYRTFKPSYI